MIKPPLQLGTALFLYKIAKNRHFYGKNARFCKLFERLALFYVIFKLVEF
jgi:hypothetical protein